jgi:hypothetical protein
MNLRSTLSTLLLLAALLPAARAASIPKPVPTAPGLIGWWRGDADPKDSAEQNDGVPQSVEYGTGLVGKAFRFAGNDSFVRVPSHESFRTLTHVTLECWVWNDPTKPFARLVTVTPDHVILGINPEGKVFIHVRFGDLAATDSGQAFYDITALATDPLPTSSWIHVAGTYDGKDASLYVDGQLVAREAAPGRLESRGAATEIYINYLRSAEVGGAIDEVALYDRALTQPEIESHFKASGAGMVMGLTLSKIAVLFPGHARFRAVGKAGKQVTIQASTDLLDWTSIFTDPNESGILDFYDSEAGTFGARYYRALYE